MSASESLGKIFLEKREKMNLTREDVSEKTYINIKVISDIESGFFDKLSSVYMKSFLKKYSDFLGLDANDVLKQYDGIARSIPEKRFSVEKKLPEKEKILPKKEMAPKKEKIPSKKEKRPSEAGSVMIEKKMHLVAIIALSIVFAVLLLILVNVVKKAFKSPPREVPVVYRSEPKGNITLKVNNVPKETNIKTSSKKDGKDNVPEKISVKLTLTARDRVWVQVASSSGGKIFDGFLNGGDSRTWEAGGTLTVWTGKANVLDFKVNGRDLGVVASGVVKNIQVSDKGVLVGDNWVTRF